MKVSQTVLHGSRDEPIGGSLIPIGQHILHHHSLTVYFINRLKVFFKT